MATITAILENRQSYKDGTFAVRIRISHNSESTYIKTDIRATPDQWDAKTQRIINHPQKLAINNMLKRFISQVESALFEIATNNRSAFASMPVKDLRSEILRIVESRDPDAQPLFRDSMKSHIDKAVAKHTKELYRQTEITMKKFVGVEYDSLTFDHITRQWLELFDEWLIHVGNSTNTRSIHFRNIRAVFNDAISNELTTKYPFKQYKIKNEPTIKRSLDFGDLRRLLNGVSNDPKEQFAIDIFALSFMLIGANLADLYALDSDNYTNGRVTYKRAKTGRILNIKVEPECDRILQKYKGEQRLLSLSERYSTVNNLTVAVNEGLSRYAERIGIGHVTSYYARHTWATFAASIDTPKETIARALGHSQNSVTDVYIRFDSSKVDELNRKIISAFITPNTDTRPVTIADCPF